MNDIDDGSLAVSISNLCLDDARHAVVGRNEVKREGRHAVPRAAARMVSLVDLQQSGSCSLPPAGIRHRFK